MEVGQQRVHHAEAMPGPDGEVGDALERAYPAVLVGRALQRAHRRRADGHHAAAVPPRAGDRRGRRRREARPLRRDPVRLHDRRGDGPEGRGSDVQGDRVDLDTGRAQPFKNLPREVQPGRRRRHGARRRRVHGLVALPVFRRRLGVTRDVRRQRRQAVRLEQRGDRPLLARDHPRAVGIGAHHAQPHPAGAEMRAGLAAPAGTDERAPDALVQRLDEQQLHRAAGIVLGQHARGNHP